MTVIDHPSKNSDRRHYECDWCGKCGPWGDGWRWYGSYRDLEDDPKSITVFCSEDCQKDGEHNGAVKPLPVKLPRRK